MIKKCLIGSQAMKHWFGDLVREPKDIDYISEEEITGTDSKFCPGFKYLVEKYPFEIAPPIVLHTLKVSHIYWDTVWYDKSIFDITFFQKQGVPIDEDLYNVLYKNWEEKFGKKKAYLKEDNKEFFKDGVKRVYNHDLLHELVAKYDRPMFERIKNDKSKAMVDKSLFDALSQEDKIQACLEEINVVSLERFLIPYNMKIHPKTARYGAIRQLVCSMTKGWFPRFIIDNFIDIYLKNNDYSYIEKVRQKVKI